MCRFSTRGKTLEKERFRYARCCPCVRSSLYASSVIDYYAYKRKHLSTKQAERCHCCLLASLSSLFSLHMQKKREGHTPLLWAREGAAHGRTYAERSWKVTLFHFLHCEMSVFVENNRIIQYNFLAQGHLSAKCPSICAGGVCVYDSGTKCVCDRKIS